MSGWLAALTRGTFALGALGLLGAMAIDFGAVLGRHSGLPLLGSIELSEVCIVCMASASLLGATLERAHARVQLLTERLNQYQDLRARLARAADALSALFFGFVLCGSGLLVLELWNGAEQSELLHIPIVPLRLIWCASALGMTLCFALRALARRRPS